MSANATTPSPDEARRAAQAILRERRFQAEKSPQPLRGLLNWLGDRVRPIGRPFGWIVRQLNEILPGGGNAVWIVLVLVVLTAATTALLRFARSRNVKAKEAERRNSDDRTAAELERQADDAERSGRFGDAVRLRFRAGLCQLAEGHAVRIPEQRPNGELVRQLDDAAFTGLTTRFDEIAYASSQASIADVLVAKDQWPGVVSVGIDMARQRQRTVAPTAKRRRWRRKRT